MFYAQIFQENIFLKIKLNFSLTGKCFSLTNFSNNKQTHKNLKNNFQKSLSKKNNHSLNLSDFFGKKFISCGYEPIRQQIGSFILRAGYGPGVLWAYREQIPSGHLAFYSFLIFLLPMGREGCSRQER